MKTILLAGFVLLASAARADVRWVAGSDSDDIKHWGSIHCGGQNGTCPCIAPYWDPTWQTSYGPGSCSAANSNTPLSVAPANARLQIVSPPPGRENVGKAVRVELKNGDLWPCSSGCGTATTRNELIYSNDSGTSTPTAYMEGDDRYFAWSTYFTAGFARWTCNDALDATGRDSACPNGVPASSYNPWNVFTQWHQNADVGGVPPIALVLRRSKTSPSGYALVLDYGMTGGSSDRELWRQDLVVETWYDFVIHLRFSQSSGGVIELWVGNDGGQRQQQLLSCVSGASLTCNTPTLFSDGKAFLAQGLYRNSSIVDDSVIFHKGMIDGDTYADAASDFSLSPTSGMASVTAGQSATYTIQTAAVSGAPRTIALAVTGLPPGVKSATISPSTVVAGGSATLTLTTDPASAGFAATFNVTGQYAGGAPGHAASASITVAPQVKPVATLVDAFAGSSIDPSLWAVAAVQGTASESGGALRLAPNASSASTAISVTSVNTYSLASSSATVAVPGVVSQGCGVNTKFALRLDAGNSVGLWAECGTLYAYAKINGTTSLRSKTTYSPTAHVYWRIRESSGTIFWETSPDKATWTQRATVPSSTFPSISAVHVAFYTETYAAVSAPGVARYANLNR